MAVSEVRQCDAAAGVQSGGGIAAAGSLRSCRPGRATASASSRLRSTWPGRPGPGSWRRTARPCSLRSVSLTSRAMALSWISAVLITPSGLMTKVPRSARPSSSMCTPNMRVSVWVGSPTSGNFALPTAGRGLVPHLVREVRVGGDDVDLGAELLELGVVVGRVFDFGRAVEGEGRRHEDQHRPLALEGLGR